MKDLWRGEPEREADLDGLVSTLLPNGLKIGDGFDLERHAVEGRRR